VGLGLLEALLNLAVQSRPVGLALQQYQNCLKSLQFQQILKFR
jgi:hypothetical protein